MARDEATEERSDREAQRSNGALSGPDAVRRAKEQLADMTGHPVESVSALSRSEDGWDVTVELIELERIPPTTNVLGSYEVQLDEEGNLVSYERIRRYHPGRVDDE
jgi:hypothetical protein